MRDADGRPVWVRSAWTQGEHGFKGLSGLALRTVILACPVQTGNGSNWFSTDVGGDHATLLLVVGSESVISSGQ